ncbi:type IV pilin protein [Thalassotalea sp. ND16A]|uniref:type IV pilin protein n=1 Tax=Thalassotalea sp. ND16A TaxID=1535422 RepID=UPI00051A2143|nr:type IV pilin protein [Thalassotalea sp. ND16A]KGJ88256.1 hypothetical protein ND16A_0196 [Thalassotalea sp. ND16A]
MHNNQTKGFTLIELMITVVIIGIIAGVAYPSFMDMMNKSRRADAHSALMELSLAQSKLRGNCTTYASGIGSVSDCANKKVKGTSSSENGYYALSVSGATGNAYTLTATAQGVQLNDTRCKKMTLAVSPSQPKGVKAPETCW